MENNERKNNNRGMFYAVMGVATLVITLIGATFAYFVATTNSAVNAIATNSTTVSLLFDDNTINAPTGAHKVTTAAGAELATGIHAELIPVDTICTADEANHTLAARKCTEGAGNTLNAFKLGSYTGWNAAKTNQTTTYRYAGGGLDDCRDSNGNYICSVYSFTVTNPAGNPSQTIYPTFTVNVNGFTNLKYAMFKGTPDQVTAFEKEWDVNGTPNTATTTFLTGTGTTGGVSFLKTLSETIATRKMVKGNPGELIIKAKSVPAAGASETGTLNGTSDWSRLVQILDADESMTYTMIFWLEETWESQNDERSKSFAANVSFTTEGDGTGVTGSLVWSQS